MTKHFTMKPFHEAHARFVDAVAANAPTQMGLRASEDDYAVAKAWVRQLAKDFDILANEVLSECRSRACVMTGSTSLGSVFEECAYNTILDEMEAMREGAARYYDAFDDRSFQARFAELERTRQRLLPASSSDRRA